jgi:hypothetical protein
MKGGRSGRHVAWFLLLTQVTRKPAVEIFLAMSLPCNILLGWLIAGCACAAESAVRINEIQVIGSHNSYHAGFAPSEARYLRSHSPDSFAGLDYSHPALTRQLDDGVRQLELDVFADGKGGRYAHPALIEQVARAGLPADPPFASAQVMRRPGFKVMHIQDIDQRSNCQPFTACLAEIRAWSHAHPRHLPLFILLETKQGALHSLPFPTVTPEVFDTTVLDALDAAIASVFPRDEYITPDDVRGNHATLNAAVLAHAWPTLAAARGKIIFLMDQRSMTVPYTRGHPGLRGRILFTNSTPGEPESAFVELNDGDAAAINRLVSAGYLVRTRTDADLEEPRRNDTRRRDALMASGAQILSTDFPAHEAAQSGYVVAFPDSRIARCNLLLRTPACHDSDLRE